MPIWVPFTQREAVLLLDAYMHSLDSDQRKIDICRQTSEDLRKLALHSGMKIDDMYRDVGGISSQMARMESAVAGQTITSPSTKLFTETVAMYRENRSEYDRILKEARSVIDGQNSNEERYAAWLAENVPSARLSELYLCYSEIDEFCAKVNLLKRPFLETTDLNAVCRAQKKVTEDRLFQVSHKKQMRNIVTAMKYYVAYLKTLAAEAAKKPEPIAAQTVPAVEKKPVCRKTAPSVTDFVKDILETAPSETVPIAPTGGVAEKSAHTIDFRQDVRLAFTRPTEIVYCNRALPCTASWTDAYVQLVQALYADHADSIPVGQSFTGGGRIDFDHAEYRRYMEDPRSVEPGMCLETNLSATDIVRKIRALLDRCRMDYETVVIRYEYKDGKKPPEAKPAPAATAAPLTAETPRTATAKGGKNAPSERTYYVYLRDTLGLDDGDCVSYIASIRTAETYAAKHTVPHTHLLDCSAEEAAATAAALIQNPEFLKRNEKRPQYFAAIRTLLECIVQKPAAPAAAAPARTVTPAPTASPARTPAPAQATSPARTPIPAPAPRRTADLTPFEKVLEQYFPRGYRKSSGLDMRKFKRYYEEINGSPLNMADDRIERLIIGCGIVYEDKVYLPKTMLDAETKEKLCAYIENTFASGTTSIYYEALFQKFSEDFLGQYIYNADMLRTYLASVYGRKYFFEKHRLSTQAYSSVKPIDEIRSCLLQQGKPTEKEEVGAILSHLPQKTIDQILGSNPEFVNNGQGEYFHADMLDLSEEETENIADIIEDAVRTHGFMSGTELLNAVRAKYPAVYENYAHYSDNGWRGALRYKLNERFSFKGNIISSIEHPLSMNDVFARFAADADHFTLDELVAFAEDMGSTIYFDRVYENALRIDEDHFVSKKRAAFRVKETDNILDRFCAGNYIPLSEIRNFGIFPDAGFPWTPYLLECFAAFYSERYTLLHIGYNRNCAAGAIVKKSAGYENYDDVLADALADSGVALQTSAALTFLQSSGYIVRRNSNIEDLLIRAKTQRNREGK